MSPSKETKKKIKSRAKAKANSKKAAKKSKPDVETVDETLEVSGEEVNASLSEGNDAVEAEAVNETSPSDEQEGGEEQQTAQEEQVENTEGEDSPLLEKEELRLVVESLLFAANKSLTLSEMAKLIGTKVDPIEVKAVVEELIEFYQDRGMVLHRVSGGFQFRTHEKSSFWVQKLIAGKPVRLSRAQVETLAIVAYRQPVTRPDIDEIRGVDSGGTLRVLLERNLVRILGKKEEPGRPLLYGTSTQFLEFFNLSELKDLPTLREFHELTDESVSEAKRRGVDLKGAKSLEEVPEPAAAASEDIEPGTEAGTDEEADLIAMSVNDGEAAQPSNDDEVTDVIESDVLVEESDDAALTTAEAVDAVDEYEDDNDDQTAQIEVVEPEVLYSDDSVDAESNESESMMASESMQDAEADSTQEGHGDESLDAKTPNPDAEEDPVDEASV